MRAGRLRQRVAIQRRTVGADTHGEPLEQWAATATVWAEVSPLIAATREVFVAGAGQQSARQTLQVRIRHREGLTPAGTRLVWEGQVLEVEAVMEPDGRRRELLLLCSVRA